MGLGFRALGPAAEHIDHKRVNNGAENAHQPFRRRERKRQRFKAPGPAQPLTSNIQSAATSTFTVQRHLHGRPTFKRYRAGAFNVWESADTGCPYRKPRSGAANMSPAQD